MNTIKKLFGVALGGISIGALLLTQGCQDNFSEKDFLSLKARQDSIAISKLAVLNEAGELLSFSIQVLEDRKPLEGVKVRISNLNSSPSASTPLEVVTNSDGIALFPKVKHGAFNVALAKENYLSVAALITVDYPIVRDAENNIIPVKISESAVLSMMTSNSAASSSTAIIKGKVTIESDLTNDRPEVPQNLTLRADLSGVGFVGAQSSNTRVEDYFINEGNIGVATVNANGEYSMIVPATVEGQFISMIYPTIELNQKVAVDHLDGKEITPEYRSVPTEFGRFTAYDEIPVIPGAHVKIVGTPVQPGTGLEFGFTPYPRSLGTWTRQSITSDFTNEGITYTITSRGSGYQSSPVFEFGSGANKAIVKTSLRGIVKSINVSNVGAGYPANVTVMIAYRENGSLGLTPVTTFDIATVNGSIPSSIALPSSGTGFDSSTPFFTDFNSAIPNRGFDVKEFVVIFTGAPTTMAAATVTVDCEIDGAMMANGGKGFTSNPGTPTVIGGDGGTGGLLTIKTFTSQWNVNIKNGGSGFSILPRSVSFSYNNQAGSGTEFSMLDKFNSTNEITALLKTVGGAVTFVDPTSSYRTVTFSESAPEAVISVSLFEPVKLRASVEAALNSAAYGKVSIDIIQNGQGYAAPFGVLVEPTVTGAPGSGAAFKLGVFNKLPTGEYVWTQSYTIISRGSGYLPNLNRVNEYLISNPLSSTPQPFSGSTSILVKSGSTVINDVKYGTGNRKEKVFDMSN